MIHFFKVICILLFSIVAVQAECPYKVGSIPVKRPEWVDNMALVELQSDETHRFQVFSVSAYTDEDADRKMRDKIAAAVHATYGLDCRSNNDGTTCSVAGFVPYRPESHPYKEKCPDGSFVLYSIVQLVPLSVARSGGWKLFTPTSEILKRQTVAEEKNKDIRKTRNQTRWFSIGGGSGVIPGLAGAYVSGRYGNTWDIFKATYGIGLAGGIGISSGDDLHFGGGVNIYPYNDFYLQYSYGTAIDSREEKFYANGSYTRKTVSENGHSVLLGYDFHISVLMLSVGGGMSKTESGWLPAWNALVGFVFR